MEQDLLRVVLGDLERAHDAQAALADALLYLKAEFGTFCPFCNGHVPPGTGKTSMFEVPGHEACVGLDHEMATSGGGKALPGYVYRFVSRLLGTN